MPERFQDVLKKAGMSRSYAPRGNESPAMVGLMSRYSGTGLAGWAVFTTSYTTTAGFGRGLNLFDQGICDPVSLISGSVVGK